MTLARRNFNKLALQFLLASAIPPTIAACQRSHSDTIAPQTLFSKAVTSKVNELVPEPGLEIDLLIPTFLGNDRRNFYGRGIPKHLKVLDKFPLGTGKTKVGSTWKTWSGAGWTGQPTLTRDREKLYLTIGSYDHHLRKIDLDTNALVWKYQFDDVLKGTATIYIDPTATEDNRIVILQGSRLGNKNSVSTSKPIPSLRAISFRTGREIWKLNIKKTASYSRDNDSSPLDLGNGLLFNAAENSIGYFLNSSTKAISEKSGFLQPEIVSEVQLYEEGDRSRQGGNLVTESSPARLGDRLYIASGSGHIYGISLTDLQIVWDFFTGSDLDGTVAISDDGKLFCSVEKQYISGSGGILKLDPTQDPQAAIEWFLPTGNANLKSWKGGVIGSVALNDRYRSGEEFPPLFATNALDGYFYLGSQHTVTGEKVKSFSGKGEYDTPLILYKKKIGASISTPIFTEGNRAIAAGYNGVYLFEFAWEKANPGDRQAAANSRGEFYRLKVEQIAEFKPGVSFEATPIVWNDRVYLCGRDGWLYTLG